jgi:hypothetical protein
MTRPVHPSPHMVAGFSTSRKLPTHTHDELFAELQSGGGALAAAAAVFDAADD